MDTDATLVIWLVGALVGNMLFFAFTVAPTVFSVMTEKQAGLFLRAFFPHYYLWGLGIALIAGAEHDQDDVLRPQLAIDFFRDIVDPEH